MKRQNKDVIVLGLALFAMFFGAGNLIFPPSLGFMAGKSWSLAGVGFFLTGIGMPLLGIIAVSKAGGTIDDIANNVSPIFSKIFATIIILAIGPLLAIPRTGATTFELGVLPLFPEASPMLVSIIYFAVTLYFAITPSEVVDKIGKILTPVLLVIVSLIIYKGIMVPPGSPAGTMQNPLATGFIEGYQTMDALASIVFGGVILNAIIAKGYKDQKLQTSLTIKAGVIAAVGLGIVYGGFIYLGASSNTVFPTDVAKTDLLIGITNNLFGNLGKVALGIVVSLACLTTSIGLTATVGEYFSGLTNNRLGYKTVVIATVLFSGFFANVGVEKIVAVAVPLLVTLYPVAIVLIVMSLFGKLIPHRAFPGAVVGALLVSLHDGLSAINLQIGFLTEAVSRIPLAEIGFAWLIPAIVGSIMGMIISSVISKGQDNLKGV